ncbi:MAG: alpha/beta fold hydrolase [Nocardioidaceae bacterium]|nr:alpha/beta fold hydrolase [Nocardioidaceae bacterium]NUS50245.1 alpha/beta fold hydrolase [Nocardioidaceae bacterium]
MLAVAGCTSEPEARDPQPTRSPSPSVTSSAPSPSPSPSTTPSPRARVGPVSVPALFDKRYDGRGLRLGDVLARTDAYTSYTVTYRSGDLRISGKLDVPRGRGPHPAVVLAHGYIDPAIYVNGQGMRREQDWLARAGYVVLHVDYRNHAASSRVPSAERRLRLGYSVDVVNAVHALRRTTKVRVDDDRIGLVGRSMGGSVIYNALVAQPGLVDAAVLFAPVSSRADDNFDRFIRQDDGAGDQALTREILDAHGSPRANPAFWRQASPRPYFDRITEPVLIQHGTVDDTCPPRWTRATYRAMKAAGVDVTLRWYAGEGHTFYGAWPLSMRRTVAFLRAHLT